MAEEEGGGGGSNVLFIVFVIFGIAFAWFVSGGPERVSVRSLFIQPPLPGGFEGIYEGDDATLRGNIDSFSSEVTKVEEALAGLGSTTPSPHKGKVYIADSSDASRTDPNDEGIVLEADAGNSGRVAISGWRLESSLTNRSVTIPNGTETLVLGQANEGAIFLNPGDRVYLSTGRSPVGTSFRVNRCSGYLNQFQSFTPSLGEMCPSAAQETAYSSSGTFNDACLDFLESFPRCRLELNLPAELPDSCRSFLLEHMTYNGCVKNHRNDQGFARGEWRVYLNQSEELWKERFEVLKLVDAAGNLVDSATY
jgi:hypothetical protein